MDIQINLINLINLFIPDLPCASVQIHDTGPKPVIGARGAPEVTADRDSLRVRNPWHRTSCSRRKDGHTELFI